MTSHSSEEPVTGVRLGATLTVNMATAQGLKKKDLELGDSVFERDDKEGGKEEEPKWPAPSSRTFFLLHIRLR
ncbi:unnamed protein product [Gadus morhua 'NCC']